MDYVRGGLRGVPATIAAFAVMGLVAAGALAWLRAPVTWPFIATVLAAAVGGPASLTGSLDTGRMAAAVHGSVGVLPLGVAVPGAVVFGVVVGWPGSSVAWSRTCGRDRHESRPISSPSRPIRRPPRLLRPTPRPPRDLTAIEVERR